MRSTVKRVSLIALAILLSSPAAAGTGKGSSAALRLDAEPPRFEFVPDLEGEIFRGGEMADFTWSSIDTHPAMHDSNRVATILVYDEVRDTREFSSDPAQEWIWPVPDISSGDCRLQLFARDEFGNTATQLSGIFSIHLSITDAPPIPGAASLAAPAPNPFNPQTTLSFTLSEHGPATLAVYDLQGRLVRRLFSGELGPGTHVQTWDGRGDDRRRVAGGPYLVRLDAGDGPIRTRKVVLLP